ncbi:hypothetical protein ACN9MN_16595 [Chryseobacterium sp. S-02]|uniref:hypothetical protein n=1 Tax=Chryseobacterium sp. S-02 TaxID=3404064 RepID=UPI003CECFF2B
MKEEGLTLSQARKLFVARVLKLDDYNELKKENQVNSQCLKKELRNINTKLRDIDRQEQLEGKLFLDLFHGCSEFDAADKKHLVSLIPPVNIDYQKGSLSLDLNDALLKVLSKKANQKNIKNEFHL